MEKISFIFCVNDNHLFQKAKQQLSQLLMPEGFTAEVIEIHHARSIASAYNQTLQVDAKYKIYLHQDTFIIYKHLLFDLIRLFKKYPKLGMIGVAGCIHLPSNGIWFAGEKLVGKVVEYRDSYQLLTFDNDANEGEDYIQVQAIDGLFMATQVDIPWREDLFDGFHFYDTSHSMEMQRAGYTVGILVLRHPWCIHYCGPTFTDHIYEHYRKIFVQHYLQ